MADLGLTREDLADFLHSQRAIRAFENLFATVTSLTNIVNINGETLDPGAQSVSADLRMEIEKVVLRAMTPNFAVKKEDFDLSPTHAHVSNDFGLGPWVSST